MFSPRLQCSSCRWTEPIAQLRNLCPVCNSPLLIHYELQPAPQLRVEIGTREANLWRFREVLPIDSPEEMVTLGEGMTPLLRATRIGSGLGLDALLIKDESQNPTRSFKSRGMAVAVTMAKKLGASALAVPTAGNAGCSLAAYAA